MSYTFDHEWERERERLKKLERGMDPGTIRCFEAVGVANGWSCLEVGAGGGSIAEWLCNRVGSNGRVVATDLQTQFVEAIDATNLEVQKHDITKDALEGEAFDLVHCRAVLEHLPSRDEVLERLIASLRPGGWLVLESHDFLSMVPVTQEGSDLFTKVSSAFLQALDQAGFDPAYGRMLGSALRSKGLGSVDVEGRFYEIGGNLPLTSVWSLVVQRLKQPLVENGLLTTQEVEQAVQLIESPGFFAMSPAVVAAWGQAGA